MRRAYKLGGKVCGVPKVQLGALLKQFSLEFIVFEQLSVGQIDEPNAESFEVIEGAGTFDVDNSGNITFKTLPDYDTQRTYFLVVKSDKNNTYDIDVYVTIWTTKTLVTGTEICYNDTYILAA